MPLEKQKRLEIFKEEWDKTKKRVFPEQDEGSSGIVGMASAVFNNKLYIGSTQFASAVSFGGNYYGNSAMYYTPPPDTDVNLIKPTRKK